MKKTVFLFIVLACVLFGDTIHADTAAEKAAREDWTFMPAGAKPAYMGIHGGTMPVSLLVSDDGSSLLTFVGRTGNDFMEVLRNVHLRVPSLGNSTLFGMQAAPDRTGLVAGNATATMPVFAISGEALTHLSLEPFGLSQEPLSIEGNVAKPENFPHSRTFRLFFLPDYFQPKRK